MQKGSEPAGGVLLHPGQHVRVDAEGHLDAFVPETLLNHLRWHARLQQECRGRVAAIPHKE
jgi:hypothetical protein